MQAVDHPYTKIINGAMQYVIPVFQRDYSWAEAECEQLLKDILTIANDPSDRGHFIGSVVYVSTGDSTAAFTRWLLIDGQQRVTTLTLLLTALRDHIKSTGWKGGTESPTAKKIEAYFLKNVQEEGDREHKLVLRRHDQDTLRALLDGEELPEQSSERIKDNYDFFVEYLQGVDPDDVYKGIGRLIVVDVTLDRGTDDPQMIFESLNSTGMDLSQSDLIRNFILMRLDEKEQTKFYETYWSKIEALFRGSEKTFDAFIRDYMALKTEASKQEKAKEIYQGFRRVFSEMVGELDGLEGLLADIHRFAKYHAAFSIGNNAFPAIAGGLARVRKLVDVPAPLIMRLLDCHDRLGTLTAESFNEALQLLETYVFRRAICGEQTRAYWTTFANLAYRIDEQDPLTSLKVGLRRLRDSYRYPSDEDFRRELVQRDLYGLRVCGFMLERLENYDTKEPSDTSSYSIEHIMPQNEKLPAAWRKMLGDDWQTIQQSWLHRLGNLTLTGYNSKYSDRPFEEKKTISGGFEESSVRLNKFIREQSQWTASEMEKRCEQLADRALTIWPALEVEQAAIDAADQAELKELAAKRDVGKVPMSEKARTLFDAISPKIAQINADVVELAESKSVSFHSPNFFLEILPRKHRLTLLLPLDFSEVDDTTGIAEDATEWKFFFYAKYEGGVSIKIKELGDIEHAIPIIRQAYSLANA